MPFCVIYSRVSSELQDVDVSINAQETELRGRAERDGYDIYEVFSDPAESGRLSDRPAFQRMMALSKQSSKPFSRIYLWDIRRFGRNRIESAVFKQRLRSRGIEIVYLKENIDDTATGRLIEAIIEAIAEYESYNIAEDTRRGHREITRRGYPHGGAAPYGLRYKTVIDGGRDRKTLEPDPEKAELIQTIYRQRADGKAPGAIARDLNKQGITASRGGNWNRASIEWVLRNPVYIGRLEYGRQSIQIVEGKTRRVKNDEATWTVSENILSPIVPLELWQQVQKIMDSSRRGGAHAKKHRVYLLSGILKCELCERGMIGGGHADSTRYYYCRVGKSQGTCSNNFVRADDIEEKVLSLLEKKLSAINMDKIIETYMEDRTKSTEHYRIVIEAQKKELTKVQKNIDNLISALQEGIAVHDIRERLNQLTQRRDTIIEEIKAQEKSSGLDLQLEKIAIQYYLENLESLFQAGRKTAPEEMREFLQQFVKVSVNPKTKHGTMEILVPQDMEKAVPFSISEKPCQFNRSRSGQI